MEDEEIEIKPPIDRIPDEYEHFQDNSDKKIHVHIFSIQNSEIQDKVKCFREKLVNKDFDIYEHSLEKDDWNETLKESKHVLNLFIHSHTFHTRSK